MRKLWLFTFLFLSLTLNLYSQSIPTNGLIAWYPFNGNANDQSGNSINGVVNGATLTTDRFGNPNSAFLFDGLSSEITIPHDPILDNVFQNDFTLSCWVLTIETAIRIRTILFKGKDNAQAPSFSGYPLWLMKDGDQSASPNQKWYAWHSITSCNPWSPAYSDTILTSRWQHLLIKREGNMNSLYVDGILQEQVSAPAFCQDTVQGPMRVGYTTGSATPQNFLGKIDDLSIYNRALTPCEIDLLYTLNLNSGLVAHYPFDGNTLDISGNNNHANNQGASFALDRNNNPNSSASFDGINDLITRNSIIDVSSQNAMSFSAWFYPEQPVNTNVNRYSGVSIGTKETGEIVLRETTSSLKLFQGVLADGNPLSTNGNNTSALANSVPYNYNNWYHVVSTYQDQKVRIYVNGQFVSENTGFNGVGGLLSNVPANSNLFMGTSFGTNNDQKFYRGRLDDVRIYNRILNDCEIVELFQPGSVVSNVSTVQACRSDTLSLSSSLDSAYWTDNQGNYLGSGSNLDFQFTNQTFILATGFNFCGCLQNDTFNIQLKAQPNYNLQDTFSICPNVFDTLPFSFNAGGTISWSDGSLFMDSTALNPIVKPISNTTNSAIYQTIYTNITNLSSGCSIIDSAILEVTPRPGYTWGSDSFFVCHKASSNPTLWTPTIPSQFLQIGYVYYGDTSFNPSGVVLTFAYRGENYDTTDRIDYFKILMEDINGCHFTDSVFTLTYARFFAEAGTDTFVCAGIEVQIGEPNDSAYSYSWTPTNLLSSANTSMTTSSAPIDSIAILTIQYFLHKTDSITGCVERDSVWIYFNRFFDIEAGDDTVLCSQQEIQLGENSTIGFSYLWQGSDSLSNPTISNPEFSYLNPDSLTQSFNLIVEITQDSTQCKNYDTVSISVKPQIYVDAGPDLDICGSDSVPIGTNHQKPYTFNWTPLLSVVNPSADSTFFSQANFTDSLQTFEYFLNADFDGCNESDSLIIDLRPKPFDDLSGPRIVCPGVDSAEYFVGRPFTDYTYNWFLDGGMISVNSNDSVIIAWDSTNFNAFVGHFPTNSFGCVGDTFIWNVRINPLLIPEIDVDTLTYCERDKSQVYNVLYPIINSNYTWFVQGGQVISGQGSNQVLVNWDSVGAGQIWVAEENITNIDSCFGTSDTLNISILPDPVLSSIQGPTDICDFGDTLTYITQSSLQGNTFWTSDSISQIIGSAQSDTIRIVTSADGNFTIKAFAFSNSGCYSDTIEENINVRYFQIPEIEIDTNKICFWDSTDFTFRIKDKYDSSVYQWTSNQGQIVQGQGDNVMRLRVYQPDTIQVYVSELNSAVEDTCYGISDTIEVYFYPKPERDLSIIGPDTLCFSQECTWYKYPGWDNSTFYWSTSAGVCNMLVSYDSIELGFSNVGSYFLDIAETSEYGCIGDTVNFGIEIFPNPETSISFNDSIICPTDRNDRIYQANGLDFSEFQWIINGGVINYGQGSDIISVHWGNNSEPSLSVFEKTFAECTSDTLDFPLFVDDMSADIFNVTFDSSFQNMHINGDAVLLEFNENDKLTLFAGEEEPGFFSSKTLEEGVEQFIIDSAFGERLIFYQFVSINACNDSLYSDLHNNILLEGTAEENSNVFNLDWSEYLAWDRNVDYKLYEYQAGEDILIETTSEDDYLFQNERTDFIQCFYVIGENQNKPELISRSNLLCFEFPRKIKIPDVVTANGDGFNDKFKIENIDLYPEHELLIFNRSGRPVLKTNSYTNTWPPDDLNTGVYYYRFRILGSNQAEFAGYIHLMR